MADATPEFLQHIDKGNFSVESQSKIIPKPWGHEVLLTPGDAPYAMKVMGINAGARLSLQAHDAKTETWTLLRGQAGVMLEDSAGDLVEIELTPGVGYTTALGQRHRLFGITDCAVVEASTPEIGTTWRLDDDYARPDETPELRADPNRGWNG